LANRPPVPGDFVVFNELYWVGGAGRLLRFGLGIANICGLDLGVLAVAVEDYSLPRRLRLPILLA